MHGSGNTRKPADSAFHAGEQGLSNLVSDWTLQIIAPTNTSQDPGKVEPLPGDILDYEDAPSTSGSPKKKSPSKVPSTGAKSGNNSRDSTTMGSLIGGVVGGLAGLLALLGGVLLAYDLTARVWLIERCL
jgi:hypothetical protein